MRAPFQILVIPCRRGSTGPEFAVLKRSDADCWQFVAGGGDDSETPIQAAQRETQEEIGITGQVIQLDSTTQSTGTVVCSPSCLCVFVREPLLRHSALRTAHLTHFAARSALVRAYRAAWRLTTPLRTPNPA